MKSEDSSSSQTSAECVLAIDYGERWVGLALAEPGRTLVGGLPTIDRKSIRGGLAKAVARLVAEHGVERIVLGMPYSMDGTEGPAAAGVRAFEDELAVAVLVPVEEWDERLTSEAARRRLRELGYSERDMQGRIDQLSAVLMLEGYLQRRAAGATEPDV
jgi:putative Holliday junction resolvase